MDVRKAMTCHENEEKIEHDYVLRNDNRINTTQPIEMVLVSFFSGDNVLSDEKKGYIFEYQSNENRAFLFFFFFGGGGGDTRYILHYYANISYNAAVPIIQC